jgi:hypothetical protein
VEDKAPPETSTHATATFNSLHLPPSPATEREKRCCPSRSNGRDDYTPTRCAAGVLWLMETCVRSCRFSSRCRASYWQPGLGLTRRNKRLAMIVLIGCLLTNLRAWTVAIGGQTAIRLSGSKLRLALPRACGERQLCGNMGSLLSNLTCSNRFCLTHCIEPDARPNKGSDAAA